GAERPDLIEDAQDRAAEDFRDMAIAPVGAMEGTLDPTRAVAEEIGGPLLISSERIRGWYETGTPSGVVRVQGEHSFVMDELLTDIAEGTTTVDFSTHPLTPSQQRQLAAATTAVMVREDPTITRPLLVTLSPDDDASFAVMSSLVELPWVTPVTLSEASALTSTPRRIATSVLSAASGLSDGAVTAAHFDDLADIEREFESIASVVEDPEAIRVQEFEQMDLLVARAWRDDPSARDGWLTSARAAVGRFDGAFTVVTPASLMMISESSHFPITVTNSLPSAAVVSVTLQATDLRLQQTEATEITVPAGGEVRVDIPVSAVGSGDLTVEVFLTASDGVPLGQSLPIEVRMRAEWENTAMLGLIGLGVISFGIGVVRTVRRNRREDRTAVIEQASEQYEAHLREVERARAARSTE
ncbi:MAG: DUF6049 family protein, partial [bacterium]|nr:DUF6049 family protein [bacterium]